MTNRAEGGEQNTTPSKSVFGDRDVSNIQGSIRVLETEVENLKQNKADKTEVSDMKSEWRGNLIAIIVPLLAALVTGVILAIIN